jgi:spore germination protein
MVRGILITILALGIAGTAFWGYQEHRDKNAVLLNAENNYQRAFHNLSFHVDLLHDKIGSTLAMNSRQSLSPGLAEVWRITSQAHSDVGQLPLTLLPFNKTQEFLANIGNFSYQAAIRDLDKTPLSNQEYNTLKVLYKQSGEIQKELRNVQSMALKHNLRWMDVEMALASGKENTDNTIIDGFKTVEKTVSGYTDTDFGPSFTNMQTKDENFNNIKAKPVSRSEAGNSAKKFVNMGQSVNVKVTQNGKGSDFGFYSVSLINTKTNEEINMDITKKGGYPIWFINSRNVTAQKLSIHDAANKAAAFLKEKGISGMELSESAQYDNIGVFDFVAKQDNIRIYPESIKLKVALDNGSIVGYSAEDYLKSHQNRAIPAPSITKEQAQAKTNPNFKVMEFREAVILNNLKKEVLCYEFLGVIDSDTYRIFINAETGQEEKVEKLKNPDEVSGNVM